MGLLDWMFGPPKKPTRPVPPPSKPTLIPGQDPDLPFVAMEQNGVMQVMDRETYDYMYGNDPRPDPAQRDLDAALRGVTRARVMAGGLAAGRSMGSEIVADTTDAAALDTLRAALRIRDRGPFNRCACPGGPTIELFAGDTLVATFGVQHGHAVRWDRWKPDAELDTGDALSDWIRANGVEPEFLDLLYHNSYGANRLPAPTPLPRTEQLVAIAERVRMNDPKKGIELCDRALALDPSLALAYGVRALARHSLADWPAAIADCTEAIARGAGVAEVYFTRGVARDSTGDPAGALDDLNEVLRQEPNHMNARNSRGGILGRMGRTDEALEDLDAAIQAKPDWFMPRGNRAIALANRGDYVGALAELDRILIGGITDRRPIPPAQHAGYYRMRAQLHDLTGNPTQAEADRKKARLWAPDPT